MSFMSFQVEEPSPEPAVEEKPQPVHTIEEVLADVQGPYNFLQDSIIDLDSKFYVLCNLSKFMPTMASA